MYICIKLNKSIFNNLLKKCKLEYKCNREQLDDLLIPSDSHGRMNNFIALTETTFSKDKFNNFKFYIDSEAVKDNTFHGTTSFQYFTFRIDDANEMRALIEREVRKHRYSYQEIINC